VALDVVTAPRAGGLFWLDRPRFALGLFAWAVPGWCLFELLNFRVVNWYYVFVPHDRAEHWLGTAASFATVFAAMWLGARAMAALGLARDWRIRPWRVTPRLRRACAALGLLSLALALLWPRVFYPATWGSITLLLEPWNYGRDPRRSLLGDLERGEPGRLVQLAAGGLFIGLVWEAYNAVAGAKWIYTVPGFEEWKLFEMPLLGFFGFSVFALDAFVLLQSLVLLGVARPPERDTAAPPLAARRVALAALAAAVFVVAVLWGIERFTISSYAPRTADFDAIPADARRALAKAGYADVRTLAAATAAEVAPVVRAADAQAIGEWIAAARLATLRGIGTENAEALRRVGVRSVAELARADPARLFERLRSAGGMDTGLREPQVRVWVRAARRASGA
jgi:predicted flap endonuclease-1-like 5' DNA nuclease